MTADIGWKRGGERTEGWKRISKAVPARLSRAGRGCIGEPVRSMPAPLMMATERLACGWPSGRGTTRLVQSSWMLTRDSADSSAFGASKYAATSSRMSSVLGSSKSISPKYSTSTAMVSSATSKRVVMSSIN